MNELSKGSARWHEVGEEGADQRIDNYLVRLLKGVPKSHIYRILRSGEVRVNSRRIGPDHRLAPGDRLRLPPVAIAHRSVPAGRGARPRLSHRILFEDDALLVLDKPAGLAVHGGSGISQGIIELLRAERPQARFLELAHRLDRDTSGALLVAKKRAALTDVHRQLREGRVRKIYTTLVKDRWREARRSVNLPLEKYVIGAGERRVKVDEDGQSAHTVFRLKRAFTDFTLLEAELKTGRTHQIRVHLAHLGYPIAGDDKYGDFALNKALASRGLKRMFLHASSLRFAHPLTHEPVDVQAPLSPDLQAFLDILAVDGSPV